MNAHTLKDRKGQDMNYLEWSREYEQAAAEMERLMERFQKERAKQGRAADRELTDKIAHYRTCRNECIDIANRLMQRHLGVA